MAPAVSHTVVIYTVVDSVLSASRKRFNAEIAGNAKNYRDQMKELLRS